MWGGAPAAAPGTLRRAMVRTAWPGTAAIILALLLAAPAAAELRTGSAPNKYPAPDESSPTRPQLERADVLYDDQAGSLTVTLTLYDGLADPATTSALRPWRFVVDIGDYLNGICSGDDRTWLGLYGTLGDSEPALLDSVFDIDNEFADAPVAKTFSADRRQVILTVTDPRLVGLGTICADAKVFDARPSRTDSSSTFAFLLDGFDAADGALAREVRDYLRGEIGTVAVRLRPRRGFSRVVPRCREIYQTEFSCRAAGRLRRAAGRPRITLRGRMSFDARGARKLGGFLQHGWQAHMRVRVNWRRCPADAPRPLRGRPCQKSARWRGNGLLADALGI